ncbi:PH domain-containing protein [Halalkalibacterium halodurans]|uniref:PH domain-containing protein n=1 Tax=Halalkalibacterium halodurans TaxID=86665 RepID=UPI002AA97CBA|nr:PH domain-containing protein [Halalkalibacterium halodurans]MDY7223269.1 PH domain-containing protein [Halalkalibacterium halodurans]MDY7242490.1 PH domain-containing protein [Halalkalibacterium halodurans]MED3645513.1 PH domain-containing protein [Halalkalibacterium halodurans]
MTFPSKKHFWIGLVLLGSAGVLFIPPIVEQSVILLIVLLPIVIFLLSIWFRTYDRIDGDRLFAISGPFRWSIPIQDIRSIEKRKTLLSGPSLSLDRLTILYGVGYDIIVISPEKEDVFLQLLLDKNPNIELKGVPENLDH